MCTSEHAWFCSFRFWMQGAGGWSHLGVQEENSTVDSQRQAGEGSRGKIWMAHVILRSHVMSCRNAIMVYWSPIPTAPLYFFLKQDPFPDFGKLSPLYPVPGCSRMWSSRPSRPRALDVALNCQWLCKWLGEDVCKRFKVKDTLLLSNHELTEKKPSLSFTVTAIVFGQAEEIKKYQMLLKEKALWPCLAYICNISLQGS